MNTPITFLPLDDITIGERRRQDDGDIAGLADSIQKWGLLHPLIVDHKNRLVAGGRRLKALQQLGYLEAPVRQWGTLNDDELRELELEENLKRKDLTPAERARTMVALAQREVAADLRDYAENFPRNGKAGHPEEPGSLRRVAERLGVDEKTIRNAQQHVETAEAFPFMQAPDWKQYHVLQAQEQIEKLPEEERPVAAALIDKPAIHPQNGIAILRNLTEMPTTKRQKIYAWNESDDTRERDLALTEAFKTPPMPDPRATILVQVNVLLRKAVTAVPEDEATGRIRSVVSDLKAIAKEINDRHAETLAREIA